MDPVDTIAILYIKILNRYPDESAFKQLLPILKQYGPNVIEQLLKKSSVYTLQEKDKLFYDFIDNNKQFVETYQFYLPQTSDKCAIICEGRKHKNIQFIVKEILHFLDDTWCLNIVCTEYNREYIKLELQGVHNVIYTIVPKLESFVDFNNLMLSKYFWNNISFDKVLIFQTDSMICKKGIEKFLKYDYIGAPLPKFQCLNGGFSIRNVKQMINCLTLFKPAKYEPEDVFFTKSLRKLNAYLPTFQEAKEFSIEGVHTEHPYAIHQAWRFHDNINELFAKVSSLF